MILKQYIESWGGEQNRHRDPKNLSVQKLRMKWMFILSILDNQGEPKIKCAWRKNSEQWELYMQVLEKLFKNGSWFLLYDNSPPHSAMTVKHFYVNRGMMEIGHSPKETDLVPFTFLWFPTVKTTFKERTQVTEDLKNKITAKLNAVRFDAFEDCFAQLSERYTKCVAVKGDYFEGN